MKKHWPRSCLVNCLALSVNSALDLFTKYFSCFWLVFLHCLLWSQLSSVPGVGCNWFVCCVAKFNYFFLSCLLLWIIMEKKSLPMVCSGQGQTLDVNCTWMDQGHVWHCSNSKIRATFSRASYEQLLIHSFVQLDMSSSKKSMDFVDLDLY
jgi:hypothetical protein